MQEENPFDIKPGDIQEPLEDYFLIKTIQWEWTQTEDLSEDEPEPFYDFDPENGRLFVSEKHDCPVCRSEKSLGVVASFMDEISGKAFEWCCLACGLVGDISWSTGQGELVPRDEEDDHFFVLPSHVVIKVER